MVREMIGGCCVCLDERGWNENPLVYCDGSGCNVAVHQACYGIVKVPSGPWFCCKCTSQERGTRVRCELCPNKGGALKRTESGEWAHVVCALYIPEVRFGDVGTMEPIIFSSVPNERFIKTCFICEENGEEKIRAINGACMSCHKVGCKLSFHVTCAQSCRLLCEEASVSGHVQYVGYCTTHWTRRFKQPPSLPVSLSNSEVRDEKKNACELRKDKSRNDSSSSTKSLDIPKPRRRKKKLDAVTDEKRDNCVGGVSLSKGATSIGKHAHLGKGKTVTPLAQTKVVDDTIYSFSNKICDEKLKGSSPLNTPVPRTEKKVKDTISDHQDIKLNKDETKKRKLNEEEKGQKRPRIDKETLARDKELNKEREKNDDVEKDRKKRLKPTHARHEKNVSEDIEKCIGEKKLKFPQSSKIGLLENGRVSTWDSVMPYQEPSDNFQDFLEHQWNESAQFIYSKADHFDVASLLTYLHQLKYDNSKLEKKLLNIRSRRDRLLGVNARLAASFTDLNENINVQSPLSAMLSKLNDKPETSIKRGKCKASSESKILKNKEPVASPDLAMLAAASLKLEGESMPIRDEGDETSDIENPGETTSHSSSTVSSMLVQPCINLRCDSMIDSSLDLFLVGQRNVYNNFFPGTSDRPSSTSSSSGNG